MRARVVEVSGILFKLNFGELSVNSKTITKDTEFVHNDLIFTINNKNIVDSNLR